MGFSDRRYTEDDVTAIVRRALEGKSASGGITHTDLVNIAAQSGITEDQLEQAIQEHETLGDMERARAEWLRRHRREFFAHFRTYLIIIGMLMIINLTTTRYPWFIWPAIGWGVGIAFHASDTFFVSEERIQRGALKLLKREKRKGRGQKLERVISDVIDDTLGSLSK